MRRDARRQHEAQPREEDRVTARVAVTARRVEDRLEVGGGRVALYRRLDDLTDQAADCAKGHQISGASLPHEQPRDQRGAKKILDASAWVFVSVIQYVSGPQGRFCTAR